MLKRRLGKVFKPNPGDFPVREEQASGLCVVWLQDKLAKFTGALARIDRNRPEPSFRVVRMADERPEANVEDPARESLAG